MPVAMIAIEEVWTSSVHKLRGVRKEPPNRPIIGDAHAAPDVEDAPDDHQRANHAKHARVDLGSAEEPGHRTFLGHGRIRSCFQLSMLIALLPRVVFLVSEEEGRAIIQTARP